MNINIKKFLSYIIIIASLLCCNKNDDITLESNLKPINNSTNSELDAYLLKNFVEPYNIEILYKFNESLLNFDRYYNPVDVNKVKPYADLISRVWIKPYGKIGGEKFIKNTVPKQIVFVGSNNVNFNSKIDNSRAESGKRIILFDINSTNFNNESTTKKLNDVKELMKNIHFEYIQILIQKKIFNIELFENITPGLYLTNWYDTESDQVAREMGFISRYARKNEKTDFAELATTIITSGTRGWQTIIQSIQSEVAKGLINSKVSIVESYFKNTWKIDIYKLQEEVDIILTDTVNQTNTN